jgi:hypothetical protein
MPLFKRLFGSYQEFHTASPDLLQMRYFKLETGIFHPTYVLCLRSSFPSLLSVPSEQISTDSNQYARTPNPPLAVRLPRTPCLHPGTLAFAYFHQSPISPVSPTRHPASKSQVSHGVFERYKTLPRPTSSVCGAVYDISQCVEDICEVREGRRRDGDRCERDEALGYG